MFMVTLSKAGIRKIGTIAICGVLLAGTVLGVNYLMEDTAVSAAAVATTKIETTQDIATFFGEYGQQVDITTATVDKVKIPKKWDDSFAAFNEVILQSGLDLKSYKGKTAEKWMVLCPALSTGENKAYSVLLVYKEKPIGTYLITQPEGAVSAITLPQQATAAPLSEAEQAAATQFATGETAEQAAAPAPASEPAQPAAAPETQPTQTTMAEVDLAQAGAEPID